MTKSRLKRATTESSDTGDYHHSGMVGQLRIFDTLDCRRKHDYERFDEGSQRVKITLGSSTAERRMERTKRRHVVSYETEDSIETYAQDET